MANFYTEQTNFYGNSKPSELLREYGSPLYVYSEAVLRQRCKDMAGLIKCPGFKSNYSIKANSNLEILKIAREEGLHADAMSPGRYMSCLRQVTSLRRSCLSQTMFPMKKCSLPSTETYS
jgi:diaminopimelate decarboxylase